MRIVIAFCLSISMIGVSVLGAENASRSLPQAYAPGNEITVTIHLDGLTEDYNGFTGFFMKETIPSECTFVESSNVSDVYWDINEEKVMIKQLNNTAGAGEYWYKLAVDNQATGDLIFSGEMTVNYGFDQATQTIVGDTTVIEGGLIMTNTDPAQDAQVAEGGQKTFSGIAESIRRSSASIAYSWELDGELIIGALTNTYSYEPDHATVTHPGTSDQKTLTIIGTDDTFTATYSWNVTVTDVNQDPSAPVVAISPASPEDENDLTCDILTPAQDPDAEDTVTYAYEWANGQRQYPGQTLSHTNTNAGEVWTCTVTVSDGWGGTAQDSATVTVGKYHPADANQDQIISLSELSDYYMTPAYIARYWQSGYHWDPNATDPGTQQQTGYWVEGK